MSQVTKLAFSSFREYFTRLGINDGEEPMLWALIREGPNHGNVNVSHLAMYTV